MKQGFIVFDDCVFDFEKKQRWNTVINYLFDKWKNDPYCLNNLLCIGTELWYVILEMDYWNNSPTTLPKNIELVSDKYLQNKLMEVTRWGFDNFADSPLFNAVFGYLIKVMPYLFIDYNGDYVGWREKGINMIKRSYEIDNSCLVIRALYCELTVQPEEQSVNDKFMDSCKALWETITPEDWGKTAVQRYFFYILNGDVFYTNAYEDNPD